jgi:hypothetical protein
MRNDGMLIKPATIPLMYQHQYKLACIPGGSSGWCWLDSLTWQGSDIKRYPSDLCSTGKDINLPQALPSIDWIETYVRIPGHVEWDADICFEEGFDQMAVEPDDVRLTSLYTQSMVIAVYLWDRKRRVADALPGLQRLLPPNLPPPPDIAYPTRP